MSTRSIMNAAAESSTSVTYRSMARMSRELVSHQAATCGRTGTPTSISILAVCGPVLSGRPSVTWQAGTLSS